MQLRREKNRLILKFPYDKEKVKHCQNMAMKFSKIKKEWSTEDVYMNRICLNRLFPGVLPPEPREETRELVVPSFLMDHQKTALRRAARQDRMGIYHDTGVGKTLLSLEIYRYHKVKTLIICPLSLIEGAWLEEINNPLAWIKNPSPEIKTIQDQYRAFDVVNLRAAKKRSPGAFNKALEKDIGIINYESFRTIDKKLGRAGYKVVVLDESARIRTFKRGNTADKVIEFCDTVKYVYELSGVPAPNNMLEYWTQIRILDPLLWGKSFYKFRTKYFLPSGYGGYTWKVREEYKKKLVEDIRSVAEYVDKEDVIDLPGTVESKRIFKLSEKEWTHYRDIKANLITILESGEKITSPSAVTAQMKLRQISSGFILDTTTEEKSGRIKKTTKAHHLGNTKLNELLSLLEDIGPKQVLIWIEFQEEARIISEALKKKRLGCGVLNGTVPENEKQKTLKSFKAGNLQYAICHPKSVGFGHTLVNCSESICYSNSYSYDNAKQLKDRIYRQGQKTKCSYYYLLADKTLDPVILEAVKNKKDVSMAILNYLKK